MRSLGDAEDWEKLEVWMLFVWRSTTPGPEVQLEDIGQMTLKLFQRRPSAIPKFEDLCEGDLGSIFLSCAVPICSDAIRVFPSFRQTIPTQSLFPLSLVGDDTF